MERLHTITSNEGLLDLIKYLEDKDFVAFDVETDGVEQESRIIGFSVCADIEEAYYVITERWNVVTKFLEVSNLSEIVIMSLLRQLGQKNLIMHNGVFDCNMVFRNYGVDLRPALHTDTLILGHLLNENRFNGLKERGVELFGEMAVEEQRLMKESVLKNGGTFLKTNKEIYKADPELIAKYGAKDAILTLKVFYHDIPILFEQGLDKFFYEEESMPLAKGPTYDLNTIGLRVDPEKLQQLKRQLETDCLEAQGFIQKEIAAYVKDKYPGTSKAKTFNVDACQQRAWLLFIRLGNEFGTLTKVGKELCRAMNMKLPYTYAARREFIQMCVDGKGKVWQAAQINKKSGKLGRPKKIADPWTYMCCGKESMVKLAEKYQWVAKYLEYAKNLKLLNTYVIGIQERMRYNIIHPSFLQHGTTSGRYSSKNPNFQNLPRDDKRIKSCIVARPGCVFVAADYAQLEPRVFASLSKDERLLNSFKKNLDIYSVVGAEVFEKYDCTLEKEGKHAFAVKYPKLRQIAKAILLSATYGTTAPKMAGLIGKSMEEAQEVIDKYFDNFPSVYSFMLDSHDEVKKNGQAMSMFGRPRRIPAAKNIEKTYGNADHSKLPYEIRKMLNLGVNHRVQSAAASIMNRAAIAFNSLYKDIFAGPKIVMQVHDEIIVECLEEEAESVSKKLKQIMENTVKLPGVDLIAEPKVGKSLAECK